MTAPCRTATSAIPFTVSPYEIEEDEEPVNARLVFRQESATRIPHRISPVGADVGPLAHRLGEFACSSRSAPSAFCRSSSDMDSCSNSSSSSTNWRPSVNQQVDRQIDVRDLPIGKYGRSGYVAVPAFNWSSSLSRNSKMLYQRSL